MPPTPRPSNRKGTVGSPGMTAIVISTAEAMSSGSGRKNNCLPKSAPSCPSPAARVVIMAPETEISSAGTTVTSPSPTVKTV